jgi:hypothetical protein
VQKQWTTAVPSSMKELAELLAQVLAVVFARQQHGGVQGPAAGMRAQHQAHEIRSRGLHQLP